MFKNKQFAKLLIIWLFLFFIVCYGVMRYTPSNSIDFSMFIMLLFATVISAIFPLKMGEMSRLNIFWFAIVVLHMYGIGPMLFFYQLAVFIFLVKERTTKSNVTQFPIYSITFLLGPLFSSMGLVLFNYFVDSTGLYYLILSSIVFYSLFLMFSCALVFLYNKMNRQKAKLNNSFLYFEMMVSLFVIALGIILYLLVESYGSVAIILALVIYICAALLLKKLDFTKRTSESLLKVMDVHNHLLDKQSQEELTEVFLQKVVQVMNADSVQFIYKKTAHYVIVNESLQRQFIHVEDKDKEHDFEKLLAIQAPIKYNHRLAWQNEKLPMIASGTESIVLLPIQIQADDYAIVMVESRKHFAFERNQLEVCTLLGNSFTAALSRVLHLESTVYKSERCSLTGLHNYRYLTEQLEIYEKQVALGTLNCVSTIILDIDYFKHLNDTYGHENGNVVLKGFADLLLEIVKDQYLIARYGGEEFVVLLPNESTGDARKIAENIRKEIALNEFKVKMIQGDESLEVPVFITVSAGVANMPEHTNEIAELINFADKALYVGAKQAGRNRVAVFQRQLANCIEY